MSFCLGILLTHTLYTPEQQTDKTSAFEDGRTDDGLIITFGLLRLAATFLLAVNPVEAVR